MMKIIEIDIKRLNEDKYDYLNELFSFPEYFGNNLDALYDVLSEKESFGVIYSDITKADDYSKRIIKVINMIIRDNYLSE
ncbi:MAG: barstar family protein [Erysipelotrichaceae bacterium]|nr:barstar family protein [Erysipelotrichaceae bacterium]